AGEPGGVVEIRVCRRVLSSSAASVGTDHGSAVSPRYTAPFTFTGRLHELVIQVSPERRPYLAEAADRTENDRQRAGWPPDTHTTEERRAGTVFGAHLE